MSSPEKPAADPAAGGNMKMLILFVAVGLIAILGAVGATLYFTDFFGKSGSGGGEHEPSEHSSAKGPPTYLELKPGFIVNTMDKGTSRFVQVGISVMSRNPEALDAVNELIFAVKNDLREVLSSRSFAEITVSAGIEALRAESEAAINKILKENHKPSIDALYFTAFVVQ